MYTAWLSSPVTMVTVNFKDPDQVDVFIFRDPSTSAVRFEKLDMFRQIVPLVSSVKEMKKV